MSAGTMIALSCKEIMMGKQSNLGPIDPQMGGVACQAVLDEFKKALADVKANPSSASLWQVIVGKYHPTFLIACQQAIEWSKKMAGAWLKINMLKGRPSLVAKVLKEFGDHSRNKSHARHISKTKCIEAGLKIVEMESDDKLRDLILTTHHAFMHTFSSTNATKIVENHLGVAYMENLPIQK
jgi:Serine dehydrogenase proteinase